MESTSAQLDQKHKSAIVHGPGRSLAQARADLGLTREDVARQLLLKPHHIVALENDNYDSLPGATYVRGYLRSYAQLLGLASEPVLEAHARMAGKSQPVALDNLNVPTQTNSSHRHIKLTTYLVASIVVGLALVWWQGHKNLPTQGVARSTTSVLTETDKPAEPANINREAPPPTAPPVTGNEVANTQSATAAEQPSVTPAKQANAPTQARAHLSLYVEQESWVEIRDAQLNRLVYESLPSGRSMMLEGLAPLYVYLGNAPGVRVEFNGEPFDVGPYKRGQVARFVLGGPQTAVVESR